MEWLSDAIPLIFIGVVQIFMAFGIGLYMLRRERGRDGRK